MLCLQFVLVGVVNARTDTSESESHRPVTSPRCNKGFAASKERFLAGAGKTKFAGVLARRPRPQRVGRPLRSEVQWGLVLLKSSQTSNVRRIVTEMENRSRRSTQILAREPDHHFFSEES